MNNNRILTRLLLVAALTFSVTTTTNAQFFKKLGKALEKIDKATDKLLGTESNEGGSGMTCKIPGLKLDFDGVTIEDGQQVISFTLTNTTDAPVKVERFEKTKNFDANGNEVYSRTAVGRSLTSLGNGIFTFEPGVPMKCKVFLVECPLETKKMSLVQIQTCDSKNYNDQFIELRNVDLSNPTVVSGPFYGKYKIDNWATMTFNFYKPDVDCTDYDDTGKLKTCYGTMLMTQGDGLRNEMSYITNVAVGQYKAVVDYIGGRDGCTYRMWLSYDPSFGYIKIEDHQIIKGMEEEFQETQLYKGLRMTRTK